MTCRLISAIIRTNAEILLIGPLKPNFSEMFNGNSYIFVQESALWNIVCEMSAILSRRQCVLLQSRFMPEYGFDTPGEEMMSKCPSSSKIMATDDIWLIIYVITIWRSTNRWEGKYTDTFHVWPNSEELTNGRRVKSIHCSYNLLLEPTVIDTDNEDSWWRWLSVKSGLLPSQFDDEWAMIIIP